MSDVKSVGFFVNGKNQKSKTKEFYDIYNPSNGEVIARAPRCTVDEVNMAVETAQKAFPAWRDTPVLKRVQVMYAFKKLIEENWLSWRAVHRH